MLQIDVFKIAQYYKKKILQMNQSSAFIINGS